MRKGKKEVVAVQVRLPKMVHRELVSQAKKNLRSMNSEIVLRLLESLT